MSDARYDVVYGPGAYECGVEPHFCREWENGEGCYGYNINHGFSWEEARENVAAFYRGLAEEWATKREGDQ